MEPTFFDKVSTNLFKAHEKVEDTDEQGICTRIKEIVLNAIYTFVYYITCCQVDLREKEVIIPSLLDYMKEHHNGMENKIEFKLTVWSGAPTDVYAWYTEVDGVPIISSHDKISFHPRSQKELTTFGFNKDGHVDTISCAERKLTSGSEYNNIVLRIILRDLEKACKLPVHTTVLPLVSFTNEQQRNNSWKTGLKYLKSQGFVKGNPHRISGMFAPLVLGRAVSVYYEDIQDGHRSKITLVGKDIHDKKLEIKVFVDERYNTFSVKANSLDVNDPDDYGYFEAMVWMNTLHNAGRSLIEPLYN